MTNELLLVYEPEQVPHVARYASGKTVVALDHEVEMELAKLNIPFVSLMSIAESPDGDRALLERTRTLAFGWYSSPETAFFEYDGIKLGEQYEVVTLYYIQTVVYWVSMLGQVFNHFTGVQKVFVFDSFQFVPKTADPSAMFKVRAVRDVAWLLSVVRGITCEVLPAPLGVAAAGGVRTLWRSVVEVGVGAFFSVLNRIITALQPPRLVRMFATDPWARLKPFVGHMADAEVVMSRRQEFKTMGFGGAFRTRARFHHRLDFVGPRELSRARAAAADMTTAWQALGATPALAKEFVHEGVSFWPVVRQFFEALVIDESEDAIATIENTKRLFAHYRINCVLLFASTKGYNNLVARVAEQMNIPSIELQHALVNNEKTLVHCRLNSRYIASYGPLINRTYASWGVEPWRTVAVGSPRFDRYANTLPTQQLEELRTRLSLHPERISVLWGMPEVYYSLEYGNYTSYEAAQVIKAVAATEQILPIQYLLRPRPGFRRSMYLPEIKRLFSSKAKVVVDENLHHLIAVADVVLTGTSTVVLEAMLMHKPVVMYVPKRLDNDFSMFWRAGAVRMARTPAELKDALKELADPTNRRVLVESADQFVQSNFLLDGNSAERVAALLRDTALVGEKIFLEPLSRRHISSEYVSWFSDPETTRYNRHGVGITVKELEEYVARVEDSDTEKVFAVMAKEGRTHIGNISLQKIDKEKKTAEFAILIGNGAYRGKHVGTEAGRLLLRWGFEALGLKRIVCATPVQHEGMRKLALRLGFKEVGVRTGAMQKGDEQWDVVDYELTQENFTR